MPPSNRITMQHFPLSVPRMLQLPNSHQQAQGFAGERLEAGTHTVETQMVMAISIIQNRATVLSRTQGMAIGCGHGRMCTFGDSSCLKR